MNIISLLKEKYQCPNCKNKVAYKVDDSDIMAEWYTCPLCQLFIEICVYGSSVDSIYTIDKIFQYNGQWYVISFEYDTHAILLYSIIFPTSPPTNNKILLEIISSRKLQGYLLKIDNDFWLNQNIDRTIERLKGYLIYL